VPLDATLYTPRHAAPTGPTAVAYIAYERRAGGWDVFVFEPPGVCPSAWESNRVDSTHILAASIEQVTDLDAVARALDARLGPEFERCPAFHMPDAAAKRGLGPRLQKLHRAGCTGYEVRHDPDGGETLWVRRKDLAVLGLDADRSGNG